MNGIENITRRIAEEAEAEARRILAEAEGEASEIRNEYEKKSDEMKSTLLERGEKTAKERAARVSGSAELEAKREALAKKQELISTAFDAAAEKLKALSDDERVKVLASLAIRAANGGAGEIILSKTDRDTIGKDILAKCAENPGVTLSNETRKIDGLVLRDGASEVNCSFEALVSELREEMSREIADILFG